MVGYYASFRPKQGEHQRHTPTRRRTPRPPAPHGRVSVLWQQPHLLDGGVEARERRGEPEDHGEGFEHPLSLTGVPRVRHELLELEGEIRRGRHGHAEIRPPTRAQGLVVGRVRR